jgi:hypothetical protein
MSEVYFPDPIVGDYVTTLKVWPSVNSSTPSTSDDVEVDHAVDWNNLSPADSSIGLVEEVSVDVSSTVSHWNPETSSYEDDTIESTIFVVSVRKADGSKVRLKYPKSQLRVYVQTGSCTAIHYDTAKIAALIEAERVSANA